jgi:hypothetical protein
VSVITIAHEGSYEVECEPIDLDPEHEGHCFIEPMSAIEVVEAWAAGDHGRNWWAAGDDDYEPFVLAYWLPDADGHRRIPAHIDMREWRHTTDMIGDPLGYSTFDFPFHLTITHQE